MKRIILALIILCYAVPGPVIAGNSKGPAALFVTVLTGAAAAAAAKNADEANAVYHKKESLVEKLKAQGIDPETHAIYAAYLQLDKNASAIYWERWFGWPNVILEVEIAGQGSFLIPRIDLKWQGQPILENLIGEYAKPGTHVLVKVLDDKKFRNEVCNSILQTKINFNVDSGIVANNLVKVDAGVGGSLQILDKQIEIVGPTCMATADFTVPDSKNGVWLADATFLDNDNKVVGTLQFQQMWTSPVHEANKAYSEYVFWLVIAGICGLVFVKLVFFQKPQTSGVNS